MFLFWIFYNLIFIPLFYIGFSLGAIFNKKMRVGLIGRLNGLRKLKIFVKKNNNREIIFIHSSSLGEWEQAVPIINKLKSISNNYLFVASFFSPSGYNAVKGNIIDYKMYLPFDDIFSSIILFRIIKPKIWIISKYDVWPNLLFSAKRVGTNVYLCSAELADDSVRFKGINKIINKNIYSKLDGIFCVSENYRNNFKNIYNKENLHVTGDSRYDRIYEKAENTRNGDTIKIFSNENLTIISGSIWPEDEQIILPAYFQILNEFENINMILVPHEVNESHLQSIELSIKNNGFSSCRYTKEKIYDNFNIVIIDTIGILSKLYMYTNIAYVGGGFGKGVHNVMEPAAFFQPVIFGPRHINSHEACELKKLKAGTSIPDTNSMYSILRELITNEKFRKECSETSGNFLLNNLGATDKILNYIVKRN